MSKLGPSTMRVLVVRLKMDGMDPVPSATVYRFYSDRFCFSRKIQKRDRKQDRDVPGPGPKTNEDFSVRIYGISYLIRIIPFLSHF
jgi:hypothetical protein